MSNRTLSGLNELSVDILKLPHQKNSIRISGNSGNALQFIRKDADNKLEFHTFNSNDIDFSPLAGKGLVYNSTNKDLDLNLNDSNIYGTAQTSLASDTDFIPYLKSSDNTTKKIAPTDLFKDIVLEQDTMTGQTAYDDETDFFIPILEESGSGTFKRFNLRLLYDQFLKNRAVPIEMDSGIDISETGGNGNSIITTGNNVLRGHINYIEGRMEFKTIDGRRVIYSKANSGNNDLELGHFDASVSSDIKVEIKNDLYPTTDNTFDLGKTDKRFDDIYCMDLHATTQINTNLINTVGDNALELDASAITVAGDGTVDIGESGTKIRDLYATGIKVGKIEVATSGHNNPSAGGRKIGESDAPFDVIYGTSLVGALTGNVTGNSATATVLQTARTIGGVSFNGSAHINLPGVNANGNQDTTGNATTASRLLSHINIGGVSFNGSANINLPGVNADGNQNTSGNSATATVLETARTIGGVSFNGSAHINLPGVNIAGSQNTSGTATTATTATNLNGNFSGDIDGGDNDLTNVSKIETTTITPFLANGTGITFDKNASRSVNELYIKNLPASSTGLSAGRIWNNGGTLSIIP